MIIRLVERLSKEIINPKISTVTSLENPKQHKSAHFLENSFQKSFTFVSVIMQIKKIT